MIVLDASVVIAHFSAHDVHHARATAFFRAHPSAAFAMHTVTMTEVLVGPIRVGRGEAAEHALSGLGIAEWMPPAASASRLARVRVESGLKLPDCCVVDVALNTGAPIATFDDRLAQAAQSLGLEVVDLPE